MSKTTHCSVMSSSTLVASSQEAEGSLFPNPILQPFHHYIRVFSITDNLFYGLQQSSGGRRVGTTGQRNILSIRERNGRHRSRRRNWEWTRLGRRCFSGFNWMHFDGRSVELRRWTPCIRRRLWRTYSRDWRALAVCTPTQPPRHLLSSDRQLTCQGNPCTLQLQTSPKTSVLVRGSDRQSAGSVDRKT